MGFQLSKKNQFQVQLNAILRKKRRQLKVDLNKYLIRLNDILGDRFAQSKEFNELKGSLKGEFGFTEGEINGLDRIIQVIKKDKVITKISASQDTVILEWVDFEELKNHEVAKHNLTRLNPKTGLFEVTQTVSWVDWLENGLSITGYKFEEKRNSPASRSKDGILRKGSGLFKLPKTKVFEKTAKSIKVKDVRTGIAAILQRKVK